MSIADNLDRIVLADAMSWAEVVSLARTEFDKALSDVAGADAVLARLAPDVREQELRDFLGSFNFRGDMATSPIEPFSGGEKARLALSLIVWQKPNLLLLDEPTNHLDLETITSFNNALKKFKGTILLTTHDHEFAQTVGTRVIELTPNGAIDRYMTFDDYMNDPKVKELRDKMYTVNA